MIAPLKIEKHFQYGNKKLPSTTAIFNCGTATECPSLKRGLCQAGGDCYAMKAEKQYPACRPYWERQRAIMDTASAGDIASALVSANKRKRNKVQKFRFNEAGDFETQADVQKMADICGQLRTEKIQSYGYTARTDLDLTPLTDTATVNVSNDGNGWIDKGCNRFKMVQEHTQGATRCAGDCRQCQLCSSMKGLEIEVLAH